MPLGPSLDFDAPDDEEPKGWTAQGPPVEPLVKCPVCGDSFRESVLLSHAHLTHGYIFEDE